MNTWNILGAGAIGGLWAICLQTARVPVTLLGRRREGRTLTLQDGSRCLSARLEQYATPPQPITRLLVTTKAQHTVTALRPLLPHLHPEADIVLLQNGMGVREELLALAPGLRIFSAITTDGVFRPGRNELVFAGHGETLLGTLDPALTATVPTLQKELAASGLAIGAAADIRDRLWQKLAINCAINPLTVRFDCRNGELLNKPEALVLMEAVCTEVATVMQAEGLPSTAEALFATARAVAAKTAANTSSMRADVLAGRSTEIDFINGFIGRQGRQHGIATPANDELASSIQALHP